MHFNAKIHLSLILWISVVILLSTEIGVVRSVIVRHNTSAETCQRIMYKGNILYQCELTLKAEEISERLMLRFDWIRMNCSDTLAIHDSPNTFGDPAYKINCDNKTESVGTIYSTNNSLSLEYVTADEVGFNSEDFRLVYASFHDSKDGCGGFICAESKYCISSEFECDAFVHCSDGSDESDCANYSNRDDYIKLIAIACFVGFILLLGIIWLCAHTRKVMRNRAIIQRNGINN